MPVRRIIPCAAQVSGKQSSYSCSTCSRGPLMRVVPESGILGCLEKLKPTSPWNLWGQRMHSLKARASILNRSRTAVHSCRPHHSKRTERVTAVALNTPNRMNLATCSVLGNSWAGVPKGRHSDRKIKVGQHQLQHCEPLACNVAYVCSLEIWSRF